MDCRQFLGRFRPTAVPGAPGPSGVPVDRAAEASAELAPVFALLAKTEAQVTRIAAPATERASRIRADADLARAGIEADAPARLRAPARNSPEEPAPNEHRDAAPELRDQPRAQRLPTLLDMAVTDVGALLGPAHSGHRTSATTDIRQ